MGKSIIYIKTIFSLSILLMLLSPALENPLGLINPQGIKDNRKLVSFSELDMSTFDSFPFELDRFINDNYGLRRFMTRVSNTLRLRIFNTSPVENIILGKQSWLFYSSRTDGNILNDYKRNNLYTNMELEEITEILIERRNILEEIGAKYIMLLVPNKGSIYPENLPARFSNNNRQSRYEQLVQHLMTNTDLSVVDTKKRLLNYKNNSNSLLYDMRGTHWNQLGAFIGGYLPLIQKMQELFPFLETQMLSDYEVEYAKNIQDLESMIGDLYPAYSIEPELTIKNLTHNGKVQNEHAIFSNDEMIEKAVILGDSFFERVQPFISKHIHEFEFYYVNSNQDFGFNRILHEKPSLVIHEIVERYLFDLNNYKYHYNIAEDYKTLGLYDKALEKYHYTLKLKPDYERAYMMIGVINFKQNKYKDAIDFIKRAIDLKHDSLEAHSTLGYIYMLTGQYDHAEKELKNALKINPNDDNTRKRLKVLYDIMNKKL
jgi:tetratricopeptide (TPR) repeat protein